MNTAQLLQRFEFHKKAGQGFMVKCPAHEDKTASLALGEGANGKIIMFCHAGCSIANILGALDLTFEDLFSEPRQAATKKPAPAEYTYRNLDGEIVYQVVRMVPKSFRQRRPDGAGGWIWNMQAVKKVPYRLPELVGKPLVIIVEGEKDADRLWSLGIPATTNVGGAGKWATETKALTEIGTQRVVILPDNDGPGGNHAQAVAKRLKAADIAVSIITLPDLPNHGDVSDWLDAGHSADELLALVNSTPYLVPKAAAIVPGPAVAIPDTPIDPATDPSRYHLTDLGTAEAFRDRNGEKLRYDYQRDRWLVWRNSFWEPDAYAEASRMAHDHAREWQQEAVALPSTHPKRSDLVDFTMRLERVNALGNVLSIARTLLPIATKGSEWDINPWEVGLPNGTLDLRTATVRPGTPSDWITKQAGTAFDHAATAAAPRWTQFLDEVFESNSELIHYVQKAVGYSLTGDMREQCFFMAVGTGANGKSMFLDSLEFVFGDYAHRAPMRLFASAAGEDNRFSMAELAGARLILAAETKPNTRMNEHIIKALTGGETMQGERKYGQPFTFRPQGKIWLGVNHHPTVADDSFGFWRRVRLIPFNRTFAGSDDQRDLKSVLKSEAAGIMAWAVEGCRLWQEEGLKPPSIVTMAVEEYEREEDPLTSFLVQVCKLGDMDDTVVFSTLYNEYTKWAAAQGIPKRSVLSAKAVGQNLKKRGFQQAPGGNAVRRYMGVSILTPSQQLDAERETSFGEGPQLWDGDVPD